MNLSWKGAYDGSQSYSQLDAVEFSNQYFVCLTANNSSNPQSPQINTDTVYWGLLNVNSNFPTQIDSFLSKQNISASDISNLSTYQNLLLTANRTPVQNDQLNSLANLLANKILFPTDINNLQSVLQNLEFFFLNNVDGYINTMQTTFQNEIDQFSYQGTWNSTFSYKRWNMMMYNNNIYIALQDNLNAAPSGYVDTNWVLLSRQGATGATGSPGLGNCVFLGAYNGSTAYAIGNVVQYGQALYYCIQATSGNTDPTNINYWELFLSGSIIIVSSSVPNNPASGECWINSTTNVLSYYNGTGWIALTPSSATSSTLGIVQLSANPNSGNPIVSSRVAQVNDQQITTTSQTTLITYTPTSQKNYEIQLYLRVVTGTTNVTLTITYNDGTGSQSDTILNNQPLSVGNYRYMPITINAINSNSINIQVTSSIANQLYVSATLIGI